MNQIESIITQLEQQRAAVDRALEALRGFEAGGAPIAKKRGRPPGKNRGGRRPISAEGRARIGEATRRRRAAKRAAEALAAKKVRKKR